ncbi:TRAP transporter large permease [Rhodanobacter aciditrophus]|uniref:TRAP transporter large permease protein n=1 Tax=Rhodanobacter aciditrophus TaxID=1623218 RepID=A0ABW4AYG2_9GAMM
MILTAVSVLLFLLALSIPVAASIGLLGVVLDKFYSFLPVTRALGEVSWSTSHEFLLVSIPLFILLGELLLRSGYAERMYDALTVWLNWLPGGLNHANIVACGLFSATSGSSVATSATVGTVAIPQARKHKYNERLFIGSLAAGGTLGILIPPSVNMIIYGVLTDTSVPRLYLAGLLPGICLILIFMIILVVACVLKPSWGGKREPASWSHRVRSLVHLLPPLLLFLVVVGSIYAGIATPTESAGLGVVAMLILAAASKRLTWRVLLEAVENTVKSTAMIMLIVLAAYFLNFVMTAVGLTDALVSSIYSLGISPNMMLLLVIGLFLLLGCFMETLSLMITTVPIIAPVMIQLGFDPIWFGILVIVLIESALITPPVGLNLFVVQNVRGSGPMHDTIIGVTPFVIGLFIMIGVLILVPGVATWLPELVMG